MEMAYQRCPAGCFHEHQAIMRDSADGTRLLPGYLHDPASARCPSCGGRLEVGTITPEGERIVVQAGA